MSLNKEKKLETVNFYVIEDWRMECPHCWHRQSAPFNEDNPMSPQKVKCSDCDEEFILTYDREA